MPKIKPKIKGWPIVKAQVPPENKRKFQKICGKKDIKESEYLRRKINELIRDNKDLIE